MTLVWVRKRPLDVSGLVATAICLQGIAKLADFGCSKQFQGVRTPVRTMFFPVAKMLLFFVHDMSAPLDRALDVLA